MGDFFHGWRRKAGVVAIVMACVFMCGWMRSIFVADSISWSSRASTVELFMSAEEKLSWQTTYVFEGRPTTVLVWNSIALDFTITDDDIDQPVWRWRFLGFEAGEFTTEITGNNSYELFCSIPYWSIVISLTMLSAYLLLSKPRKASQMKPAELIAEKVV